jgi:Arc/MetJ family transcription regulator
MLKRTTIELDEELLARAKQAFGQPITRATVEEALCRATESVQWELGERRERQLRFFETLDDHLDLDVLASDEMWR